MTTTAFFTRFHYPHWDESVHWRFDFFKMFVLPRIKAQDPTVDICIWCHPSDRSLFRSLGCQTFDARPTGERSKGRQNEFDFIKPYGGLRYDLQIAVDSDDLLLRKDFISKIRSTLKMRNDSEHISFNWQYWDMDSLKMAPNKIAYSEDKGTAFYALWQHPDQKDFTFIYEKSHLRIGHEMDKRYFIEDNSYCAVAVHPHNDTTSLPPGLIK